VIQDQPPPKPSIGRPIWEIVIEDVERRPMSNEPSARLMLADMCERDAIGRQRYGMPLMAHNGRAPLVDAYQEYLDGVVYLRQALEEGLPVRHLYEDALRLALHVRGAIETLGTTDMQNTELRRDNLLAEVRELLQQAITKHGNGFPGGMGTGVVTRAEVEAWQAKCDEAHRAGTNTLWRVLTEEVAELGAETDPGRVRAELLDVVTPCLRAILQLDARGGP